MKRLRQFHADERGAVFVEYIVIVTVCLAVALALASVGPKTVENYAAQRALLYQSSP